MSFSNETHRTAAGLLPRMDGATRLYVSHKREARVSVSGKYPEICTKVGGAKWLSRQASKMSYGYAPKNTGWIISGLKNVIDRPLDPTLVDNTPKLLDILNKAADRLPKLLNKRDERGYTLLHFAAERNQPESLKCLLIKEGKPSNRVLTTAKMHGDFYTNSPGRLIH